MSEIKYGLITEKDWGVLKNTLDLIIPDFWREKINIIEIGLYNCQTSIALSDYVKSREVDCIYTGIDNLKDKTTDYIMQYANVYSKLIIGNSTEVYNQIPDDSQHLIFVDGDHSFIGVISDFFAYAPKVKVGGYFCFHDTGKHIKPFKDFQHGEIDNPDAYISVRKALNRIGILNDNHIDRILDFTYDFNTGDVNNWELVFDEADETNEAGGITVFKRLY